MPRKPHRHDNPNRAIHNRKADPKRAAKRIESRIMFLKQIEKEREIGVDPIFDHSRGRGDDRLRLNSEWLRRSQEYDERVK